MSMIPGFSMAGLAVKKTVRKAAEPIVTPLIMLVSGTFFLPFYGIYYFLSHPVLWAYMMTVLIPELIVTCMVYVMMYSVFYPPQAIVAIFFNGPSGIFTAWLAMIQQSARAARYVSMWIILPTPMKMLFDAVMTREGCDDLVVTGRARRTVKPGMISRVRLWIRTLPRRTLFPIWFLKTVVFFALNFVPVVGPIILVFLEAPKRGRQAHGRYFELKGYSPAQVNNYAKGRRGQYTGFGLVANMLEAIPVIGVFFLFTNTVSGALWAASLEKAERQRLGSFRYASKQKAHKFLTGRNY